MCTMSADACAVVVICSHPVCTCCLPFLHPACVVLQPACVGLSLGCVLCPCVLGISCRHSQQECARSRASQCVSHSLQQVCMDAVWCVVVVVLVARVQTMPASPWPAQNQQEPQQRTPHSPCVSSTTPLMTALFCAGGVVLLTACMRSTHQSWCALVDCMQAQHISLDVQRRASLMMLSCMLCVCSRPSMCVLWTHSGCWMYYAGYHFVWLYDGSQHGPEHGAQH